LNKQLLFHVFIPFYFFLLVLLLSSCVTNNQVTINTKYSNTDLSRKDLERNGIRITSVIDNRNNKNETASNLDPVKMSKRTKFVYELDEPVSDFVERILNKMIVGENKTNQYVNVSISIEKLSYSEDKGQKQDKGILECKLNFSYYLKPDSNITLTTYIKINSGDKIYDNIETGDFLILGLYQIAEQFINYYDKHDKYLVESNLIPAVRKVKYESKPTNKVGKALCMDMPIGGKEHYGIMFGFKFIFNDEKTLFANALAIRMNIGYIFAIGPEWSPRIYLDESRVGFFFEGGAALLFPMQHTMSSSLNLTLGASYRASLGVKLGFLLIQGGFFGTAFSGNLQSDSGLMVGFGFQF
jgi:hypothetical protein